jgi:hypothetical protein
LLGDQDQVHNGWSAKRWAGAASPKDHLNGDGVNVVDLQIDLNAAVNLGCPAR